MKILFVTSEIPFPVNNGVRIAVFNAMRLMYEAGHQLAWASIDDRECKEDDDRVSSIINLFNIKYFFLEKLEQRPKIVFMFKSIWKNYPYGIIRYHTKNINIKLKKIINDFKPEVIHFDLILMTQYHNIVPLNIGTIASINDSYALYLENALCLGNYHGHAKILRSIQLMQVKFYEKTILPQFNIVHTMTEIDAAYLKELNPKIETCAIPNAIADSNFKKPEENPDKVDICFTAPLKGANLHYLQNFLQDAWPEIHKIHPEVKFHVVGQIYPESKTLINFSNRIGGVVYHGFIEDISTIYSKCGIAAIPINKKCGLINKAIEGMAAGLAIVGLDNTFAGIPEVKPFVHCMSSKDYKGMATNINYLLDNPAQLMKMRNAGWNIADKYYRWDNRKEKYEEMYKNAIKRATQKLKGEKYD